MADKDFRADLTAFIDDELGPDEVRALEAALARDPALRALEQKLRRTVTAVEALPPLQPSSIALRRQVLNAIDAEPRPFGERVRAWLTPGRLVPVGVAMAAAVTTLVLWAPSAEEQPADAESLLMAQQMDVVEDLDLVGVDSADDLEVIAALHELEVQR
jgi:anti-sigma factor RsiW